MVHRLDVVDQGVPGERVLQLEMGAESREDSPEAVPSDRMKENVGVAPLLELPSARDPPLKFRGGKASRRIPHFPGQGIVFEIGSGGVGGESGAAGEKKEPEKCTIPREQRISLRNRSEKNLGKRGVGSKVRNLT
jgi:hypothetical protein